MARRSRRKAIRDHVALLGVACALFGLGAQPALAQAPFDQVIDRYVREGLRSNLAMQSETLEVEKAAEALAEARARFFPEITLEGRYSRAEGGREIGIPLGTALNPVYVTLNEMLVAEGLDPRFPQVRDQAVPFLREREQDTRLVVRQPIFAPAIPAAVRAQRALLDASSYRRMAIARALRRDITVAYVDWLKAHDSVAIVAASETLLRENVRVNESLYENGKITEDQVLRARRIARGRTTKAGSRKPGQPSAQLPQLLVESRPHDAYRAKRATRHDERARCGARTAVGERAHTKARGCASRRVARSERRADSHRPTSQVADAFDRARCRHARRNVPSRRRLQLRGRIARLHVAALRRRRGFRSHCSGTRCSASARAARRGARPTDPPRSAAGIRSPADGPRLARNGT